MTPLELLEEIRIDFTAKSDFDPQIDRVCRVMIAEFASRSKQLTPTKRNLLLDFALYSENDKTSTALDECVDNYLDYIKTEEDERRNS